MGAAFPIRKDALIKQVQDAVAMVSASRVGSYTAMLQKSTQELARRHGDESDCPHDSTTLQDEIAELVAAGDAMMERAKKRKEATIDIMEEDTQKYEAKINALGDKVKEFVEAVGYKTSCKINEARAQYQKKYWQVTKIAQHLVEGSHTTSVAKIFSEQISQQMGGMNTEDWLPGGDGAMFAVNPVFAEFTGDLPAWWNEASMVARAFADVLVKLEVAIEIKEDALLQKLGEEQKWHGVVGDVSGCSLDLAHVPFKNGLDTFVEADHVGAQPWLAAMKKNTRRHGPTAVPSPGVPMLIVPRKSLFVHCYPCEALCEKRHPVAELRALPRNPRRLHRREEVGRDGFGQQGLPLLHPCWLRCAPCVLRCAGEEGEKLGHRDGVVHLSSLAVQEEVGFAQQEREVRLVVVAQVLHQG